MSPPKILMNRTVSLQTCWNESDVLSVFHRASASNRFMRSQEINLVELFDSP